jgi:pyruvate dehydrogenase (quinone)
LTSFSDLGVPARLSDALARQGIDTPTPIQAATLPDSFAEAKGFLTTLAKGDPAESSVIGNSARAVAAELFAKARNALTRED